MFAYIPHELSLLQNLAPLRPEWLTPFILPLNNCDSAPFYMLLGALGFIFIKPKFGQRLWALFAIVFVATYFFKGVFMQPRPFILDPALGLLTFKSEYGLPSGAAMAATCLAILTWHDVQNKLIKRFVLAYALLIIFSRIYLGVHFISDVVVGSMMGALISFVFLSVIEPVERVIDKMPLNRLVTLVFGMGLLGHMFIDKNSYLFALSILCGVIVSRVLLKDMTTQILSVKAKNSLALLSVFLVYGALYFVKSVKHTPVILVGVFIVLVITLGWRTLTQAPKVALR